MNLDELELLERARRDCITGRARKLRKAAGVSLSEVADALDVSPTAITRWESGQRRPRGGAAVLYAKLLERWRSEHPN
jgi:transcriptional regulator with XRE-family HTH domain